MIKLLKYNLNSEFDSNKDSLKQLDNYVALTEDNQTIHLKPLPNIFYVTTNNTGTTISKWTAVSNEEVTLENGENKLTDWNYGFFFNDGFKQEQITSFDLSKYDTSNVTSMDGMFISCSGLTSLDLTNFDTSKVSRMDYMFCQCSRLTSLDLSNFNTSKVTNMSHMFRECSNLTSLDLSNFNTTNVTRMISMFSNCIKLTHIKCKQAFKDWCLTNQTNIDLPETMVNGTVGNDSSYNWEIVEIQS